MCILFDEHPNLGVGWGCCCCKTYNALRRDRCKRCGEVHHTVGTNESPDLLDAREDEESEGCPHDPACPRCGPAMGLSRCDGCGRNLSFEDTVKLYLDGRGGVLASTHPRCTWAGEVKA